MHKIFKALYHTKSFFQKSIYKVLYGKNMRIGKGTSFRSNFSASVEKNALLIIGNDCFFNNNCIINAHERIEIGNKTIFGPNVMIYDHDHDYHNDIDSYLSMPVSIGNNCWIGGNVAILRGSKIGNNVVIAAGSIVSKEVPDNAVIIQKRETTIIKK